MQRIRHRLKVDWDNIAPLCLDPMDIPPEVEMKAGLPSNTGRPALVGPGRIERVDLNPYREGRRLQKLVFEMARDLTRDYRQQPHCDAPAHVLFPQIGAIVGRYLSAAISRRRSTLYGLVLFAAAWLVFWTQPLAVRGVLPVLGGSPAVWNTAMVFFQLALPLGSHPSRHTPIVAGSRPHHLDRHLDRQMSALAPTTYPTTTLSSTIPILPRQR